MLADIGNAQGKSDPPIRVRQQIYGGLPTLVILPEGQLLKKSFRLVANEASGPDAIHLEFQGNTLTVSGMRETVKNIALNGTFRYDWHILDAIAEYKRDIQAGIHAPLPMLIGIPANVPQVYAQLHLDIPSGNAVPNARRLHVVEISMDRSPSWPQPAASRGNTRSPVPGFTVPDDTAPAPGQAMPSVAVAGATWSTLEKIRKWKKGISLSQAGSAAAASTRHESASLSKLLASNAERERLRAIRSTDSDAGTAARRDAEISIDPAVSQLSGQAEYPLFAESRPEDMVRAARGILILLEPEQQGQLVELLQQVRHDLRQLDRARQTGKEPSVESWQSRLNNSVSRFLEAHRSHDLLGLTRRGVTVSDLSEFAQSLRFRTFVDRMIELHEAFCTARNISDGQFAPSESGDTQHQIEMETGAANNAADKLLHLASTQAGK